VDVEELADIVVDGVPDEAPFGPLRERYGLGMQLDGVPALLERFGLRFPGAP